MTDRRSGFSVIELLIIMVVLGILVFIAIGQFDSVSDDIRRETFAKRLKVSLEKARFDSVKRSSRNSGEMSRVVIHSPTSFSVHADLNYNGILETIDIQQTTLNNDIQFRDNSWNFPLLIRFDKNGHTIATDGYNNSITPNFEICEERCSAPASNTNANIISVSPTGTVVLLRGGDAILTYTNPAVTSVTPTDGVDPMVSTN